jgi:type I restriction enzyme, S subunit
MLDDSLPPAWRVVRLTEIGEVNRGRSRYRPRYAEHLYGGPYPFIQTGDIKASGGRITAYAQTYSEAGLAQSRLWPAGTMCITIAANIAETAILTFPACFPDSVVGFIADESQCDVRFVEYMFRLLREGIQHEATGSVQDNINLEILGELRFPLPPLPEQRAIAQILGTLDDKIELNRRMNETLEAIARAIFKSWFVDFDPVRAKAEGRQPFGMDVETAALFPASFEDSPLGKIPKAWRAGKLDDIIDIYGGGTPKTSVREFWDGTVPWFSVVDAPRPSDVFAIDTEKKITEAGVENSSAKVLPAGTVVISARGTVGRLEVIS